MIGTWRVDAATVPNGPSSALAKDATLSLTSDHQFVMAPSDQLQMKGAWGLTDQQVVLTPMSLVGPSPFEPGKTMEIPVAQAAEAMKAMPSAAGQNPDSVTKPMNLKVADDGKSMTSTDNIVLRKEA